MSKKKSDSRNSKPIVQPVAAKRDVLRTSETTNESAVRVASAKTGEAKRPGPFPRVSSIEEARRRTLARAVAKQIAR